MTRTLFLFLLAAGAALYGQKTFEGTVIYTTKFEGAMAKQMADMLRGQLPEKMTVAYRGNKSRTDLGEKVVITDVDSGMVYVLNPALQTYQKAPIHESNLSACPQSKVSKTKDKTKILGYNAEKYIIEVTTEQGPTKMEIWATPELRVNEALCRNNDLTRGAKVEGLPLRISVEVPGADLRIVFLATQLSKTAPEPSLFEVPPGYVEEKAEQD